MLFLVSDCYDTANGNDVTSLQLEVNVDGLCIKRLLIRERLEYER